MSPSLYKIGQAIANGSDSDSDESHHNHIHMVNTLYIYEPFQSNLVKQTHHGFMYLTKEPETQKFNINDRYLFSIGEK